MTQRGFSLLELMVTLLISSILAGILYSALNQITRSVGRVDSISAVDLPVMTFYDRIERDITGAFIPPIGNPDAASDAFAKQLKEAKEQEEKDEESQKDKKESSLQSFLKKQAPKKQASLLDIQVKKVFTYEEQDNNVSLCTFITCNPVPEYREAKPRIVRVIYTLKRDKKNYTLWRKESVKLDFTAAQQDGREFTLLRNITSLRFELLAPKPTTQEQKDQPQQAGQQKTEQPEKKQKAAPLLKYNHWPIENEETNKDDKKTGADIPQFVRVILTYHNPLSQTEEKSEKKYEFLFPILCFRAPSQSLLNTPLLHLKREEQKKKLSEQEEKEAAEQAKKPGEQKQPPAQPKNPLLAQLALAPQDPHQRANMVGPGR